MSHRLTKNMNFDKMIVAMIEARELIGNFWAEKYPSNITRL